MFDNMQDASANCADKKLSPLLTFWRAVHRSNLAWEAVGSSVKEVSHIFQQLMSLCSYFRKSGLRSQELRQTAAEHGYKLLRLPSKSNGQNIHMTFWLPFCSLSWLCWNTLRNWLRLHPVVSISSWLTLITFARFPSWWTYSPFFPRFQKQIQSDDITVLDLNRYTERVKTEIAVAENKCAHCWMGWTDRLRRRSLRMKAYSIMKSMPSTNVTTEKKASITNM